MAGDPFFILLIFHNGNIICERKVKPREKRDNAVKEGEDDE